jgi:hypothetical protein
MLLTGRKFLLTSLVLVFTTKLVNACDYLPEFKEQYFREAAEKDFNVKLYFFSAVFFIIANLALFFVRGKKDYWVPLTMVAIALISAPITLFSGIVDMCGDSFVKGMRINFFIFLVFLIYQLLLWATRTSLQFKRAKITTVDLR